MRLPWTLVLLLPGASAFAQHRFFDLEHWLSDTETWYRNGDQPWWVEEELPGQWFEGWYEQEVDRQNRVVKLQDWSRKVWATVGPSGVVVTSDTDGSKSERQGGWGTRSFCMGEAGCIRLRGKGDFTLEFGEEMSPAETIPLRLLVDESTDKALVLVTDDGAPRRFQVFEKAVEEQDAAGTKVATHPGHLTTQQNEISIIRDLEPAVVINPGQPIGMITLNTPQIHNWAKFAEVNQIHYAKKYGYTLYIYRETLLPRATVTWNKIKVIPKHLVDHDYLMWIDADAIVTDMDKRIEDVVAKAPTKDFLACGDIGGWLLNTGVMIFKNSDWAKKMLSDLWAKDHWGHDRGAEQNQLIHMFRAEYSKFSKVRHGWKVFPECEFNCHPRHHKEGHYIMHMMGDSGENRKNTFTEWNNKLGVDMSSLQAHDEL